jgi:hypothetical protein
MDVLNHPMPSPRRAAGIISVIAVRMAVVETVQQPADNRAENYGSQHKRTHRQTYLRFVAAHLFDKQRQRWIAS